MDRTAKLLLALIALGLWANAIVPLLRPFPSHAQDINDIYEKVKSIESDVGRIQRGTCTNGKIC